MKPQIIYTLMLSSILAMALYAAAIPQPYQSPLEAYDCPNHCQECVQSCTHDCEMEFNCRCKGHGHRKGHRK